MHVTILIVNWNGGEELRNCLASVVGTRQDLEVQVIVVDNASRDGSREMAEREFPDYEVVNSGANLGFGKANNLARPRVQSELVLFLNPDTVLLEGSLVSMVAFLQTHKEIGVLGCKMRSPNGDTHELGLQYYPSPWTEFLIGLFVPPDPPSWLRAFLPYFDPNHSGYVKKLYGGCLLCRKEALDQVGWFDERYFMYAEDGDLCRAMVDRGWRLYYLASAEIIHLASGSSRKAPSGFAILMKAESIAKMMDKHYGRLGAVLYRLGTLFTSTLRIAALCVLKVAANVIHPRARKDYSASLFKHRLLVLWALRLRQAQIAE